jgi:hypothetical protein
MVVIFCLLKLPIFFIQSIVTAQFTHVQNAILVVEFLLLPLQVIDYQDVISHRLITESRLTLALCYFLSLFSLCRGLRNIIRLAIKRIDSSEWENIPVPSRQADKFSLFGLALDYAYKMKLKSFCSVRAMVALNLHNYASGRNPWGQLKPEYLEKVC